MLQPQLLPPDGQSQMHSHVTKMRSDKSLKISSTEKSSNINYEADVNHTLRYTRYLLGFLGVWSMVSKNTTKMEKNASKLLIIICLLTPAFIVIPTTHYAIMREKNMVARLVLFSPIGFFFTNFVKYVIILFRCRMIKLCIEHMRTDWMIIQSEKERATMMRNQKVGHDLTVIYSVFLYTCGFSYSTVMPLWTGKTINEFNETVRPLVYPGYDAFIDSQSSPTYEIIFCTICVSTLVGAIVSSAICNCAAVFVTHACGQVQILISRIGSIVEGISESDNSDYISERISFVVRCHAKALRLATNIEVLLSEICFMEVFASTMTICLSEFCFMMELNSSGVVGIITYFLIFMAQSCNIYIYCHIGELLTEQYHKIGTAAYMVQWYKLPDKIGINLVMIIIMASSPRKIKAGNMIELTISSFSNIMRMTITYLNMLRKLTD